MFLDPATSPNLSQPPLPANVSSGMNMDTNDAGLLDDGAFDLVAAEQAQDVAVNEPPPTLSPRRAKNKKAEKKYGDNKGAEMQFLARVVDGLPPKYRLPIKKQRISIPETLRTASHAIL